MTTEDQGRGGAFGTSGQADLAYRNRTSFRSVPPAMVIASHVARDKGRPTLRPVPATPVAELAADVPPVQNVAQDPVHVPWLPPRLEDSATAISANGGHQPQQHRRCLMQAQALAPTWRFGARTPDSSPRADMDLLTRRHLLAGCQPGEYGQPRDQRGVRARKPVLDRVQGLLFPRAQTRHSSLHRFAMA
jgi:hypothetical protein